MIRCMRFVRGAFFCAALCLPVAAFAARAPAPESLTINRVVAVVNGEMVSLFDLEMASTPELAKARLNPRNPAHAEKARAIMAKGLENMITDIIVVQEAERLKISAAQRDVDAELDVMAKRAKLSTEELLEQLQLQGMTKDQVSDRLRKRILQQRLLANMVGRKVIVSKDEVAAEFAARDSVLTLPGKISFGVIIYPPNIDAEAWASRIQSGAVSFSDAVKQVSIGPRRAQGGQLGLMDEAEVLPHLHERLQGVPAGQTTGVFVMEGMKTQIKVLERIDGQRLTMLEEAAPYIEEQLRAPRLEQRYKEYLEQLRKKALVEIRL